MKSLVAFIFRLLLRTRYKIKILDQHKLEKLKSTLILPNHPSETDPVILSAFLWNKLKPQPVVLETVFMMPGINYILRYIKAIAMPDMEQGSGFYKRKRIEHALEETANRISHGNNILIYPSGRLSLDGRETLGGASGLAKILSYLHHKEREDIKILLIRTRGLWGSRFSKAQTAGRRPDILAESLNALKVIFKNLIFFVPKRTVEIEFKIESLDKLSSLNATELNRYLEDWYNQKGPEKLNLVKDYFWQSQPVASLKNSVSSFKPVEIDYDSSQKVIAYLAKLSSKDISQISASSSLSEDLALDSLSIAELLLWLQDEFNITDLELSELKIINDIFRVLAGHSNHQHNLQKAPEKWNKFSHTGTASIDKGIKNLPQAIISSCKQNKSLPAISDPVLGIKSYSDFMKASLIFSEYIKTLKGDKIAILLPASGTVAIITLAVWLAKKTPVYLNWTAGLRNLKYGIESLEINQILTAGSFLDKLSNDLSEISSLFVLLEEIKSGFTLKSKLKVMLLSLLPESYLIKLLDIDKIHDSEAAAILFTSGSEANPKTVPLSHKNILTNIKDIFSSFDIKKSDVLFSFLPPFHSFGLTVTTLMPLVGGLRVAFYPNPNESRKIANNCFTWAVTMMAGTPSFLKSVFLSASEECFRTLRVIMSGAEKLPEELKALVKNKAPESNLLEGYGITECAPVVCAQRLGLGQTGVGSCFPSVNLLIVNPETFEPVPDGQNGLVLVSGESVFSGYLEKNLNPFVIVQGKKWYNSGDLGHISNECLVLAGRLKRFVKIGGEMISLPALEEALSRKYNTGNDENQQTINQFAIIDIHENGNDRASLILYTNMKELDSDKVNQTLKNSGFSSLSKIKEVRFLQELPLLGSGKINYVSLREQAVDSGTESA